MDQNLRMLKIHLDHFSSYTNYFQMSGLQDSCWQPTICIKNWRSILLRCCRIDEVCFSSVVRISLRAIYATCHMCNVELKFIDLKHTKVKNARLTRNETPQVIGIRTEHKTTQHNGAEKTLQLVKKLKTNLVLISKSAVNERKVSLIYGKLSWLSVKMYIL